MYICSDDTTFEECPVQITIGDDEDDPDFE